MPQRKPNPPSYNRTQCYRDKMSTFLRYDRWKLGSVEAAICWTCVDGYSYTAQARERLCRDGVGPRGYRGRERGAAFRSDAEGDVRQPWELLRIFQRTY